MELLWDRATKFAQTVIVTWPRWLLCPYMVKNFKKIFFSETNRPMTLKLSMHHWVLEYCQVCLNDDPELTLTYFTARSNMVLYIFVWEKGKTTDFSETIVVYDLKLATGDRSDKKFLLTSILCLLRAVCPLPRGYIHVLNREKKIVLNQTRKRFLWNLQQMGKVIRPFCWHQTFAPWGLSAPAPGLYTCFKSWKKWYKIRLQRDVFETCNKWPKIQHVPVDKKNLSQGVISPCPGAIYMYKIMKKKCIKSDFIEIFFKLVANDRRDKRFLLI